MEEEEQEVRFVGGGWRRTDNHTNNNIQTTHCACNYRLGTELCVGWFTEDLNPEEGKHGKQEE